MIDELYFCAAQCTRCYDACQIEKEKDKYPSVYNMMKPNNVTSALFYAIQGLDEVVGFLVITTIGNRVLDKKCAISDISRVAQLISSM